jgi:DNA-binding GntR family transcriptional regulator
LRQATLRGEFKEGQPLLQDKVANHFGVGKIPAREALLQLKAEGLTCFYPNRGATVAKLSAGKVNGIYTIRIASEALYQPCGMPHLMAHIHTLHANVQRYLVSYLASQDHYNGAQRQHSASPRTCQRGDIEAAADQLTRHLAQAAEKMSSLLQARQANDQLHKSQ